MQTGFLSMVRAEVFLLRKRVATWVIFGIWTIVTLLFAYILPYSSYRTGSQTFAESFESMLPPEVAQTIGTGMPFYGGSLALILGALSVGSEFGWGTWKTILTQRPGRLTVFGAKMTALGLFMVLFVVAALTLGAIASVVIASVEGVAITGPGVATVIETILGGWLILSVWSAAGVLLATLTRGTSLAIGVGILWSLAFEGLLSAAATSLSWLDWIVDLLIRANGYSLVSSISGSTNLSTDGPGAFSGPFVSGTQAVLVLTAYLVVFLAASAALLRRRDLDS